MAILNANVDEISIDKLKQDDMAMTDPLDKSHSDRIKIYDKNLGWALHPEEKTAAESFRSDVNEEVGRLKKSLSNYTNSYQSAMAAGDEKAQGILSQYQHTDGQKKVNVRVMNGQSVEATYSVNSDWAKQYMPDLNGTKHGSNWNVDVKQGGHTVGAEIHKIMREAQQETSLVDSRTSGVNQAVDQNRSAAEQAINSERSIAERQYNQNVDHIQANIDYVKSLWTNFVSDMRSSYQRGIETNQGGIRDLNESGVLVARGGVKK